MLSDKNYQPIVTGLCSTGINLNISLDFIMQSYFAISKNVTLNSSH